MKTITLKKENGSWMAIFPEDDPVVSLFGTNVLPTAYMDFMASDEAAARISLLNPGYNVEVK